MSWAGYCDNLAAKGAFHNGIFGRDGQPWAVQELSCTPQEITKLVNTIATNDQSVFSTGLIVNGQRWTVILLDNDTSVMVLKGKDRENNKKSLVVALSAKAVILGANKDENTQGGQVRSVVESIKDYLKSVSY